MQIQSVINPVIHLAPISLFPLIVIGQPNWSYNTKWLLTRFGGLNIIGVAHRIKLEFTCRLQVKTKATVVDLKPKDNLPNLPGEAHV